MTIVTGISGQGEGIVDHDGRRIYIPFTAPGDQIDVSSSPPALSVPGANRRAKICRHFGVCGGCQVQHLPAADYTSWKQELLTQALGRAGVNASVAPMREFPVAERRRAVLVFKRTKGEPNLGFHVRRSHTVVALEECPILSEELQAALPLLRTMTAMIPGNSEITVAVLASTTGLDIAWLSSRDAIKPQQQQAISLFAAKQPIARVTHNGDLLYQRAAPIIVCGTASVTPPPGGFVQASNLAQNAMAELITDFCHDAHLVFDLFSGFGSFTFPLSQVSAVHAYDGDAAAISALVAARDATPDLLPVSATTRDLFRSPLQPDELAQADGVVFDPPRAGAEAQATQLALSRVSRIVAVSCNPKTLARDLAILLNGGYRIDDITPIDQFRFTPHLETVVRLSRP